MSVKKTQDGIWSNSPLLQVENYYTLEPAVNRSKWFAEKLKKYDFSSIYEPGIFSGRNLKYIVDSFPEVRVGGFDINQTALDFAKSKIPQAELENIDFYEMPTDKKWDIVFTSGVLIHIVPEHIKNIVQKCIDKANKYVLHIEGCGNNRVLCGPDPKLKPLKVKDKFQWEPDIKKIYEELGYKVIMTELPDELKTFGATHFIEVDLKGE